MGAGTCARAREIGRARDAWLPAGERDARRSGTAGQRGQTSAGKRLDEIDRVAQRCDGDAKHDGERDDRCGRIGDVERRDAVFGAGHRAAAQLFDHDAREGDPDSTPERLAEDHQSPGGRRQPLRGRVLHDEDEVRMNGRRAGADERALAGAACAPGVSRRPRGRAGGRPVTAADASAETGEVGRVA